MAQLGRGRLGSYEAAVDALRGEGCGAGGYRLAAADGDDYPLCCRHLAYAWRMFTAYPREELSELLSALS